MAESDRERRIRERAYRLWEEQGRPEGRHEDHWLQASQETGEDIFAEGGSPDAQERPGALDGGLLPEGGLIAGGGPASSGVGGLGMTGEEPAAEAAPAKKPRARRSAGATMASGTGAALGGVGAVDGTMPAPTRKRAPRKTTI